MQKNNHSNAAALQTATPKNGYKVTPETAALLDCVRATDELHGRITAALQQLYGDIETEADVVTQKAQPYLEHTNAITDLLHEELRTRLTDAVGDVNNRNADSINI